MLDRPEREYWGFIFATLGATLAAAGLAFWFAWGLSRTVAINQVVLGIVVHVLFGYIVVMSGLTIYHSEMSLEECLIAAKWCFGGLGLMVVFVVWASVSQLRLGTVPLEFLNQLVVVGSVGAAAGVLIGLNRGQAVQNERLVERKDDQRETLLFVLQLLRHDIDNDLLAISNHLDLLKSETESGSDRERVDRVETRIASMRELLETADTLIDTETGQTETRPVDISAVLDHQLQKVSTPGDGPEIETEITPGLYVEGSELLSELFGNVVENAVEHNSTEGLVVSVGAERAGSEIEVIVEDNGSGIPAAIRSDVLEPGVQGDRSDGDGLGLYLVSRLVDAYDGTLHIEDADPGTRFTIRFPAAEPESR